jgi:hypothetical protein
LNTFEFYRAAVLLCCGLKIINGNTAALHQLQHF